jgi:LPS sulfotransferase NodH
MMWNDFERFRSDLRNATPGARSFNDTKLLDRTFPDLRYVWLRREDKIRQGVSWWRASTADEWAVPEGETATGSVPEFDAAGIAALVRFASTCEQGWRDWFAAHKIDPIEVTYEQLIDNRLLTTNVVLEHLDLPRLDSDALPATRYRRQADDVTEDYVRRFRATIR